MHVIVGLGNPGARYAATRHNVGFLVVDELARRHHANLLPGKASQGANATIRNRSVFLMQPQTYMNLSGEAVAALLPPPCGEDLIVVHDDLDLDRGAVRVKRGGGCGGHRGLLSLVESVGSEFTRVRVGIGRPTDGQAVADFVLGNFDAAEAGRLRESIGTAADAVECVVAEGATLAMNRYNTRRKPEDKAAHDS